MTNLINLALITISLIINLFLLESRNSSSGLLLLMDLQVICPLFTHLNFAISLKPSFVLLSSRH